ncbi:hypothetical protein DFH11DRAFT_1744983 [Phellopilus nigrolimitatus]|nr:hypothetical protein DFH11DRAFT_1744983 [Phellopilus nigrolimitatus]
MSMELSIRKTDLCNLRDKLKIAANEVVQHSAALSLGVTEMGGKNEQSYDNPKNMLYKDSTVAVRLRDGRCADEVLAYARETQHEKTIYDLMDDMVTMLLAEKDFILRYGGVYAVALAYAGTSNYGAIRKPLHIAVSDTSDDVRRAAVTSLAFVLFKNPGQVPRIVLQRSPCAGTRLQDAVVILKPMTKDPVDFVRQGVIAIYVVHSQYIVADIYEDPMSCFGAALGQGLTDAGGRNVTISLQSRAGSRNTSAIVAMDTSELRTADSLHKLDEEVEQSKLSAVLIELALAVAEELEEELAKGPKAEVALTMGVMQDVLDELLLCTSRK